jgi:hypothetical protein
MNHVILIENRPGEICSESFIIMTIKEFELLKKRSDETVQESIDEFGSYFIISDGDIVIQEIKSLEEYWNYINKKYISEEKVELIKNVFNLDNEPILRFGMNKFFFPAK